MNWTLEVPDDFQFPCDLSMDQFLDYVKDMGWMFMVKSGNLMAIFYGPVLWTICWVGIALNVFLIFPNLVFNFSSTSIFTSGISLALVAHSFLLLFKSDILQGKSIIMRPVDYYLSDE